MVSRLTFEEAHRFLEAHREAVLLDVREEPEYITGHPVYADAMTDLLLLFVCASVVAIYGRIRHNALVERYRPQPAPTK